MSFNHKITDLKFHINKLVPKDVCKYFINVYEENKNLTDTERSYKYKSKKIEIDNFNCINLTRLYENDISFSKPLNLAKKYITLILIS